MRHRKSGRRLNRRSAHRKAMFQNMIISLVKHEVIKTTLPKAKELRRYIEPLITLAKSDSVANRRLAFDRLRNRETVTKLFNVIGPASKDRQGGYLRVLKCGFRLNDAAPMAYVELVDRENFVVSEEAKKAPKKEKAAKAEVKKEEVVVAEKIVDDLPKQEDVAVKEEAEIIEIKE